MSASNYQRRQPSEQRGRSASASRVAATTVASSVASVKSTRQTQPPLATRLPTPLPAAVAKNAKGDSSRHATLRRNRRGAQTEVAEALQTSVAKNASGDSKPCRDGMATSHCDHYPRPRRTSQQSNRRDQLTRLGDACRVETDAALAAICSHVFSLGLRNRIAAPKVARVAAQKNNAKRASWRYGSPTNPSSNCRIASRLMATTQRRFGQSRGRWKRLLVGLDGLNAPSSECFWRLLVESSNPPPTRLRRASYT